MGRKGRIIYLSFLVIFVYIGHPSSAYSWNHKNFYSEISSPLNDQRAKKTLVIGGAVTTVLVVFFKDTIINPLQEEVTEKNRLGQYDATIELMGRVVPNALYTVSMLGGAYFSKENKSTYLEAAEIMFKATAYSGLVTNILKYTIRQKRPYGDQRNSFPSGHTTTAFAFASVVAERHPWYYGVPAYLLASLVGFQRINANRHYLHDVIAGATIGTVFGIGLNSLLSSKKTKSNISVSLIPYSSGGKINLNYSF